MKKMNNLLINKKIIKYEKLVIIGVLLFNGLLFSTPIVFAETTDPLAVINNLSNFMAKAIRAVGFIILMFGVLQIGMSIKSNDPSQRSNGVLSFIGGLFIAFAPDILNNILLK